MLQSSPQETTNPQKRKKKKVLVFYRHFGFTLGGGEYLPLTFISELQKSCDVILALNWTSHFERAVRLFGIRIDLERLKLVQVMPKWYHGTNNGILLSFYRFCRLKRLAKEADVCISLANIMDFGKPAHHFLITIDLGDEAFQDYIKSHARSKKVPLAKRIRLFLMNRCLRPLLGMRTKKSIICDSREHIYPNSIFAENLLRGFYGSFNCKVFYPPTVFEFLRKDVPRDSYLVVYLGRISPAKRIVDIIEIVDRARILSGVDIRLSLAGHLGSAQFKKALSQLTGGKEWIVFPGEVYGEEKERFLLSGSFAIHAMREEAFGISITEYLKAGIIPIVPDAGGSMEVVDNPSLTYHDKEDAARILTRLLQDESFRLAQRKLCAERAKFFSMESYMERQKKVLDEILSNVDIQEGK